MNAPKAPTLKTWLAASAVFLGTLAPAAHAVTVNANDVVINGESFFGASNIKDELNRLARGAGVIGPAESFRQIAVSGALIAQILGYYNNASPKPKYLISDGGGNDLMNACPAPAGPDCPTVQTAFATVKAYFDSMRTGGTEKVLWMRYPDPQGASWATLKTNQDLFNPLVKSVCDTVTMPKCVWIDLRPVWEGHYSEYTSDGIHATNAGGTATAEAFWKVIVDSNFFGAPASVDRIGQGGGESFFRATGGNGLRVQILEPGLHTVSIHDISGRQLARRRGKFPGDYRFKEIDQAGLYIVQVNLNDKVKAQKVYIRD